MPIPLSRTENFSFMRSVVRSSTAHGHHDLATVRELHCVVHQIDQYLSESQGIAYEVRRDIGLRGDQELEILLLGLLPDDGG